LRPTDTFLLLELLPKYLEVLDSEFASVIATFSKASVREISQLRDGDERFGIFLAPDTQDTITFVRLGGTGRQLEHAKDLESFLAFHGSLWTGSSSNLRPLSTLTTTHGPEAE
jgi:hypothetical protein